MGDSEVEFNPEMSVAGALDTALQQGQAAQVLRERRHRPSDHSPPGPDSTLPSFLSGGVGSGGASGLSVWAVRLLSRGQLHSRPCSDHALPSPHESVTQLGCRCSGGTQHTRTCVTCTPPPHVCLMSLCPFSRTPADRCSVGQTGPHARLYSGLRAHHVPGGSCQHPCGRRQGWEPQGSQRRQPYTCHQLTPRERRGRSHSTHFVPRPLPASCFVLSPPGGAGVLSRGRSLLSTGSGPAPLRVSAPASGEAWSVLPGGQVTVSPGSLPRTCKPGRLQLVLGATLWVGQAGPQVLLSGVSLTLPQTRACGSGWELKFQWVELSLL